jgi:hypothetical protein
LGAEIAGDQVKRLCRSGRDGDGIALQYQYFVHHAEQALFE